ncbi:hypothetical protein [Cystobacter fuscus]|uniref:hypothetical protein n=1 Tax=Cystobacter fuscus TaxID=43 RepID=UPI002B2874C2|nr:hypothetical protein F0U63_44225 [Cystobacter fuscus]
MNMQMATLMVLVGTAGGLSGCAVQQPSPGCQIQDGLWQVAYIPKHPVDVSRSCETLTADQFGVFKYMLPVSEDPQAPASVALRPLAAVALTTYIDTTGTRRPRVTLSPPADPSSPTDPTGSLRASALATALSAFSQEPDDRDVCLAPSFSRISIEAQAVADASGGPLPARTVDYQFSNVSVYSSPSAPGTTFEGSLVFGDGSCTAEYRVLGLSPAVPCGTTDDCRNPALGINPELDVVCLNGGCSPNPARTIPFLK